MATSAPSSSSACAFTAELEKLMAGLDCSLGQCSALSIRRTRQSVELKVSWASPGAPAPHLRPKKKGKSPSTKQRSARRGRAHRERQEQQRQPGTGRQPRRPGLSPAAQPWRPSSLATQAAPEASAMDTASDVPADSSSPSSTPIPSPAPLPPSDSPGLPANPGVVGGAGESVGVSRRREEEAGSGARS